MSLKELLTSLLNKDTLSNEDFDIFLKSLNEFNISSNLKKEIINCFKNLNWLFVGIDFNALEDFVDALQTKDPNKLDIYIKGYDSHSFRAYYYWKDKMPDINLSVESINTIPNVYKSYRQASKAPSFALNYNGTYLTLMKNCGFSEEEAKRIEAAYHEMYKVSDAWKQSKIKQACVDGYVTVALGLKVRTPMLKQVGYENISKNKLASQEMRTAGNALGQGWGVLNDRAMNAVMDEIDKLGLSLDILPINKVHDCCYYLVRNDIKLVKLLNDLVVKEAKWQEPEDLQHPIVKLKGQLDIFFPDWSNPLTLPEDCLEEQLIELAQQHMEKLNNV